MNSHMKWWLNLLILNWSRFSFNLKFDSVRENVSLFQSNHYPCFAVRSLPALRLLHCCCLVATGWRCCNGRRRAAHSRVGRTSTGPFKHMKDVTAVVICWACLSAKKETLETIKLRDSQRTKGLHCHLPCSQSGPTLLATTLHKTRSSMFGLFRGVSWQSAALVLRACSIMRI